MVCTSSFVVSNHKEAFISRLAGYCVVTYLLGVGDRHLDNLLVAPDGDFCLTLQKCTI